MYVSSKFQNLAWRKENDIDNILNESWTDLDTEFKFLIDGCDHEGRPTAVVSCKKLNELQPKHTSRILFTFTFMHMLGIGN